MIDIVRGIVVLCGDVHYTRHKTPYGRFERYPMVYRKMRELL